MDKIGRLSLSLRGTLSRYLSAQQTSGYNVFNVLGVSNKEVLMCRVLTDLLNPHGCHKHGNYYLCSFMTNVLQYKLSDEQLSTAGVFAEYLIPGGKRIDIVIQGNDFFVPIEVKINAGDQDNQCYDYYQYAKTRDVSAKVIYLTKWGTSPSKISISSADGADCLDDDNVRCISFSGDIIAWLKNLLAQGEQGDMCVIIKQYVDAIRNFTSDISEEFKMDIAEEVLKSEERFRTALAVAESINAIKARLIYLVLQEFDKQMDAVLDEFSLKRETRFGWYEYQDEATEKFYRKDSWPGINYVFENIHLSGGAELWLRVEVPAEAAMYAGLCLFSTTGEDGEGCQIDDIPPALEREVLAQLNVDVDKDGWWLTWWWLPTGGREDALQQDLHPDFRGNMSEAARKLADGDYREDFTKKCVTIIQKHLQKMQKEN